MPEALTWNAWAERWAMLFGLSADKGEKRLADWVRLFVDAGIRPEEVNDATDWLAFHGAGKFPHEQLIAIFERVNEQRLLRGLNRKDDDAWGECALCFGGGSVSVPHPKHYHALPCRYRLGVFCDCPAGRAARRRMGETADRGLTLEQYETRFPDWRKRDEANAEYRRQTDPPGRPPAPDFAAKVNRLLSRARQARRNSA